MRTLALSLSISTICRLPFFGCTNDGVARLISLSFSQSITATATCFAQSIRISLLTATF